MSAQVTLTPIVGYIPKGAFCTHRRMKFQSCGTCAKCNTKYGRRPCAVECPECGLYYSFDETKQSFED